MGLEQVGLEGVFKTEAFASGLSKYTSGLNKAVSDTGNAGGAMGQALAKGITIGVEALAAVAVAAVTAAAAVSASILTISISAGKASHDLEVLSAKTNLSTTALQEWNYAGQFLGVTADDIATAFYRLSNAAYTASHSGKTANEQLLAFQQLGLNIYGVGGKLKDTNLLFEQALDALKKIKDPTLQDALAMKIFGRGVQELMPLVKLGSKGIEELMLQAHVLGAVMSEEDVAAFAKFDDTLDMIKSSITGMSRTFVAQFLPALQGISSGIVSFLMDVHGIANTDDLLNVGKKWMFNLTAGMMAGLAKMRTQFPAIMKKITTFFSKAFPMVVEFGKTLLYTIIRGITVALPTLAQAALDIGKTIWDAITSDWSTIKTAGSDLMKALGDAIKTGWAAILPGLPTVAEIVTWVLGKATEWSAEFNTWMSHIDWPGISQGIVAAISGQPWNFAGSSIGKIGANLWDAITDAVFGHPKTTMNMNTHQAETVLTGGIDWGAIGISIGKAMADAIVGALHTAFGIGNVTGWSALVDEWKGIGTQWGAIAGTSAGDEFMKLYYSTILTGLFGWVAPLGQAMGDAIGKAFTIAGTAIAHAFQVGVIDPLQAVWTKMINAFILDLNMFIIDINKVEAAINALLGVKNYTPLELIPFIQSTESTPTVPVPGSAPVDKGERDAYRSSSRATTNNITINNPTAEPASTSVDMTLRRLSYLGVS